MAKKASGAKKVQATAAPRRSGKPVRLDLSEQDKQRLDRVAKFKGLNMAAYSRMAVLDRMRKDEEEMGGAPPIEVEAARRRRIVVPKEGDDAL
jgi:hypothetical protein